jgi:hypothetical protein
MAFHGVVDVRHVRRDVAAANPGELSSLSKFDQCADEIAARAPHESRGLLVVGW